MGKFSCLFSIVGFAFTIVGLVTSIIAFARYINARYSVIHIGNEKSFSLYAVKSSINTSTFSFSECTDFNVGGVRFAHENINDFLKVFQNTFDKIWLSILYWINWSFIVAFTVYEVIMKIREDKERSCLYRHFKRLAKVTFAPASFILVCVDVTKPCICFPNYIIRMTDFASYFLWLMKTLLPVYSILVAIYILAANDENRGCAFGLLTILVLLFSIPMGFAYLILFSGYSLSKLITSSMMLSNLFDFFSTSFCKE